MKERPILFSGEMVRAILDGRKTQTRRALKKVSADCEGVFHFEGFHWRQFFRDDKGVMRPKSWLERCPYGEPGDRLWVRETHMIENHPEGERLVWKADLAARWGHGCQKIHYLNRENGWEPAGRWRPSIYMHRCDSRITLEIVNVHVERLHDISEDDAKAEGVLNDEHVTPVERFRWLWEHIHSPESWEANPWVWVVEFRKLEDGKGGA